MIVDDLRDLCQIWNLASLDGGTSFISLVGAGADGTDDGTLTTRYVGLHMSVERRVHCAAPTLGTLDLIVDGKTLRDSLSLLPAQAEVKLLTTPQRLTLSTSGAKIGLALTEKGGSLVVDNPASELVLRVSRDTITSHAKVLAGMVARKTTQIILTGINIQVSKSGLVLRSCDGGASVAMVAMPMSAPLPMAGMERPDGASSITPQAADLVGALELMVDEEIELGISTKKLRITDSRNEVLLSGLSGVYPTLDKLPRRLPHHIALDSNAVQNACRAANMFDANKIVHIDISEGRAVLRTIESESGSFVVHNSDGGDADLNIDLDADILNGIAVSDCTMHYDHGRALVILHSGSRYVWLSPIIRK